MNRISGKKFFREFFSNYIGRDSVVIFLFLLMSLYFILTKTLFLHEHKKSDWLRRINKSLESKVSGTFSAKDKNGDFVILDWQKTLPKEKNYFENMNKISDLFCSSRIVEQLDFWRKYPEKCPVELKAFLGDKIENVDQISLKEKALALGKLKFSPDFSDSDDIVFFVNLRDKKTNDILGAAIFGIGGEYEYGDVFIRDLISKPEVRDRGLGTLLASTIFKIVPDLKKIRAYVLDTNKNVINVYYFWEFEKVEKSLPVGKEGLISLVYDIEKSKGLQTVSTNLKFIK